MSSDEQALLQAIIANPDDDLPRLVYADWLDENGRPERAEFIRLDIHLAHGVIDGYKRRRLIARRDELFADCRDEWLASLGPDVAECRFARGFVERLTVPGYHFSGRSPAWSRCTPVRHLRIVGSGVECDAVFRSSVLRHVVVLDMASCELTSDDLTGLSAAPLERLTELNLDANRVGDEGAQLLAHARSLAGLQVLRVAANNIGDRGFESIATSQHLGCLVGLSFSDNPITSAILGLLRNSPLALRLRRFVFDPSRCREGGWPWPTPYQLSQFGFVVPRE